MDKEYIQLCAEIAYNNVILEADLEDSYDVTINEAEKDLSLTDKMIVFFDKIKNAILTVCKKIQDFIIEKIKELKKRIEEYKKKKEAKQEATSLTEAIDYTQAMNDFYNKVIENKLIKSEKEHLNRLHDCVNDIDMWFEKSKDEKEFSNEKAIYNIEKISKDFIENADKDIADCSKDQISKDLADTIMSKIDTDEMRSNLPTNTALNICIDISKRHEKSVREYISVIDASKKNMQKRFTNLCNTIGVQSGQRKTCMSYCRSLVGVYSKSSTCLNKLQSGYAQATVLLFKTIPSTFSA